MIDVLVFGTVASLFVAVPWLLQRLRTKRIAAARGPLERRAFQLVDGARWERPGEPTWADVGEQITLKRRVPWRGPVVRTGVGEGVGDATFDARFAADWPPAAVPGPRGAVREVLLACADEGEVRLDEEGISVLLPNHAGGGSVDRALDAIEALAALLDAGPAVDVVVAEEPLALAERALRHVWRQDPPRARALARAHGRPGPISWQLLWTALAGDPKAFASAVLEARDDEASCRAALERLPPETRWDALVWLGRAPHGLLAVLTEWLDEVRTEEAPGRARDVLVDWSVAGPAPSERVAVARLWDLAGPAWTADDLAAVAWCAERLRGPRLMDALRWIAGQDPARAAPALRVLASGFTGTEREQVEATLDGLREAHGGAGALSLVDGAGGGLAVVESGSANEERRGAMALAERRQREGREP